MGSDQAMLKKENELPAHNLPRYLMDVLQEEIG